MRIQFTKMHGLGNDFVVIDAVSQHVNLRASQIQKLANRHTGVGFDQLLLIEPPSRPDADFDYRIFNSDGGEVEHCGTLLVQICDRSRTDIEACDYREYGTWIDRT